MFSQLWRSSGPQELPRNVREILESKYRLDSEAMGRLRLLEKSGKYAGRPVRFVRIFDMTQVPANTPVPLKYGTLGDGDYPKAVHFDGHIEKQGLVLLNDRRARKGQANAVAAR